MKKWNEWNEFAMKGLSKYDFEIILICLVLSALFYDLNFNTACDFSFAIVVYIASWYICTYFSILLEKLVLFFKKRKELKK